MPTQSRPTFSERYCEVHRLASADFTEHLLRQGLHAPLRWLWPIIRGPLMDKFDVERGYIQGIALLRTRSELEQELAEYSNHPQNRSLGRRIMRQRLSTRRLRRLLAQSRERNSSAA